MQRNDEAKSSFVKKDKNVITHKCEKCGVIKNNKAAIDDDLSIFEHIYETPYLDNDSHSYLPLGVYKPFGEDEE